MSAACGRCGRPRKRPGTCDPCRAEAARLERLARVALQPAPTRRSRSALTALLYAGNLPRAVASGPLPGPGYFTRYVDRDGREFTVENAPVTPEVLEAALAQHAKERR